MYHFEAFMGKGMSAFTNGNYKKSLVALTFAKYLRPNLPVVYGYLAEVNVAMGDFEDAALNKEIEEDKIKLEASLLN